MGISCAITLLCFLLPLIVELYATVQNTVPGVFIMILGHTFTLCNMDSLLDLFIFTLRHKDLKLATIYMLKCKELTEARLSQMITNRNRRTINARKPGNAAVER